MSVPPCSDADDAKRQVEAHLETRLTFTPIADPPHRASRGFRFDTADGSTFALLVYGA